LDFLAHTFADFDLVASFKQLRHPYQVDAVPHSYLVDSAGCMVKKSAQYLYQLLLQLFDPETRLQALFCLASLLTNTVMAESPFVFQVLLHFL
jgi:hypothetical protein